MPYLFEYGQTCGNQTLMLFFFQCKERYEKAALLFRNLEDGARSEQDRILLGKCILLWKWQIIFSLNAILSKLLNSFKVNER